MKGNQHFLKCRKALSIAIVCGFVVILCAIAHIEFNEQTEISQPTEYFKGTHLSHYSVAMDVEVMNQLIAEKASLYEQAKQEGAIEEASYFTKRDMLEAALFSDGTEEKELLESYGIYECDLVMQDSSNGPVKNIELLAPKMYYNAEDGNWIITCGGYYTGEDYKKRLLPGDIGGRDHFGFHFSEMAGDYTSYLTDAYAVIQDGEGNVREDTTSRSSMYADKGVDFELQDYTYLDKGLRIQYVGARWYCACSYAPGFENYGGVLTAFYNHTD